jgi:cell division protein FtsL
MPPKKSTKTEAAEGSKKKPRKKKVSVAPVAKSAPEPVRKAPAPNHSSSKKSGVGGLFVFVILIAILTVAGVYVFQQRQTDTVSSKLSELENKLQDKIGEIEEVMEKTSMEEEVAKKEAEKFEGMRKYGSNIYNYSFYYPKHYQIEQVDSGRGGLSKESVLLQDPTTKVGPDLLSQPQDWTGPHISASIYYKSPNEPLDDWIAENRQYAVMEEDTDLSEIIVGDISGYELTEEGLSFLDKIIVPFESYVLIMSAWYTGEDDQVRSDFQEVIKTISFE